MAKVNEMLKHIMLDLESWGVSPYSTIISIGACVFDPYADDPAKPVHAIITDRFEVAIDPVSCQGLLRPDPKTLLWWMDPKRDTARSAWVNMPKVALREALDGFANWLGSLGGKDDLRIWGDGAGFDNVLLRQAYEVTLREVPWSFRHDRCFRTLRAMLILEEGNYFGAAHTALADAENQAIRANQIVRRLGIKLA